MEALQKFPIFFSNVILMIFFNKKVLKLVDSSADVLTNPWKHSRNSQFFFPNVIIMIFFNKKVLKLVDPSADVLTNPWKHS
jgi:uncharacterized membrane protein